jgi:DNA-binding NarL/FixJ family response regulator
LDVSVRVLLVDDHAVLRQSLAEALTSEPDLEVVGEAADGIAAVEAAQKLRPDVIIIDIVLPRLNGIEATRRIKQDLPDVQIIGLSAYPSSGYAARMIEAGACAYVLKSGGLEELLRAIRAACQGQTYLSAGMNDLGA